MGIVYIYIFPNGKRYIGQTVQNLERRARKGEGYKGCPLIYNAIQKYGWDNIQKEIYECSSEEEMDNLEKFLIQKYNTTSYDCGYNLQDGGHKNKHHSIETKTKISQSLKGENNPMFGKHHSEEAKEKMRNAKLGRITSEETRQKMRDSHIGMSLSEEAKQKLRDHNGNSKKVICLETKEIFISASEAARKVGLKTPFDIRKICGGSKTTKTAGGYHWAWLEDYENEDLK